MKGRLSGSKLYCYAPNKYTVAADSIRARWPKYAAELEQLATVPKMDWITSASLVSTVGPRVTAAGSQLASFVLYAIPNRDLGSHSAGGAADAAAYRSLVDSFANQLAGRKAIVDLEPDAVSMAGRMGASDRDARYGLVGYAAKKLSEAGAAVYIDAGSSNWIPAAEIGQRLILAGIEHAAGFALNTSGTQWTTDEHEYAKAIRAVVGDDKGYGIDTGRNGLGPFDQHEASPGDACFVPPDRPDYEDSDWLNAPGRGIGTRGSVNVNQTMWPGCDWTMWVKGPGGSDGVDSRGHGVAGAFDLWEALALRGRARPKFQAVP